VRLRRATALTAVLAQRFRGAIPLVLAFTGIESVPGYASWQATVADARVPLLGHRFEEPSAANPASRSWQEQLEDTIGARLRGVAMAALSALDLSAGHELFHFLVRMSAGLENAPNVVPYLLQRKRGEIVWDSVFLVSLSDTATVRILQQQLFAAAPDAAAGLGPAG